ncbi:MAG: DUF1456 family protein [Cetobacterium sp.]|uniref:DUF1456 family protein n=1 Tax=unclassified Cetobacterium TaxID=2630983 RepID=UPI00163C947D|nr:DUF1456 family protein [Cetobacterium sp. 2A]MBC2856916.1 DUF1456 family protein [Cetobacterium sp. 2A]
MTNNDVLRRVRYALRINDKTMTEIFNLGDLELTLENVIDLLKKPEDEGFVNCNNKTLDAFLTGLITYKRGKLQLKPGQTAKPVEVISNSAKNLNNHILRKLRIALDFKSEDMLAAFKLGEVIISESELSALFRRPDHKNYKECGDKYVRTFIKGITLMFRGE